MLALAACNKTPVDVNSMEGTASTGYLQMTFPDGIETKAAATSGEKKISTLLIAVFDQSGKLETLHECTADEIAAASEGIVMNVRTGTKTVWAIANVDPAKLSSASTLDAYGKAEVLLSETGDSGFAMKGEASQLAVKSDVTTAASITLRRFASRVSLVKVNNALPASYGKLTVKSAYLANVVCNDNIAQDAQATLWCNPLGHNGTPLTAANVIGNGSTVAENPGLTFCTVGTDVQNGASADFTGKYVYGFRNASAANPVARSQGFPKNGCKSVLYVIATIGGTDYWYPVLIDTMASNYSSNVELTITMPGQRPDDEDFGTLVTKGKLDATVTVSDWFDGSSYKETI